MKATIEQFQALKKQIGKTPFNDRASGDPVEEALDRLSNLESVVGGIIDLMIEACEEDEG